MLGETKKGRKMFGIKESCHVDMVLVQNAKTLKKDSSGDAERQISESFGVNFSPSKGRVTSMKGETVVVLLEILDPRKSMGKHWSQCHRAPVKVATP
jgi:hypothetical protein